MGKLSCAVKTFPGLVIYQQHGEKRSSDQRSNEETQSVFFFLSHFNKRVFSLSACIVGNYWLLNKTNDYYIVITT